MRMTMVSLSRQRLEIEGSKCFQKYNFVAGGHVLGVYNAEILMR